MSTRSPASPAIDSISRRFGVHPAERPLKISIFGMGYVGCVSGACFAALGHSVIGVEPNPTKVALINSGQSPIVEADLPELLKETVANGSYRATSDWRDAVAKSEVAMVCVGTPSRRNGSIDTAYVRRVCEQIGEALRNKSEFFTVVIRSTVVPGSVEDVLIPVLEKESGKRAGEDFGVCMNPEFLRESTSVHDFYDPPKTVVGQINEKSGNVLETLYAGLPGAKIRTAIRVAEMVKYVDNAFHALKVTFANEVGALAKQLHVDSHEVMEIFCRDTKLNLSPYYLKPGFAFGGSCLPKDLRALTHEAHVLDLDVPLLRSILESNKLQILKVIRDLTEFKGKRLGFLGLSFKGGTDDLRESPIVEVIEALIGKGFDLKIYDKHVSLAKLMGANKEYIEKEIPHLSRLMATSLEEVMTYADVIIVSNKGAEFGPAIEAYAGKKTIVDLVRIIDRQKAVGLDYHGIAW